jgi:hypothetical protein
MWKKVTVYNQVRACIALRHSREASMHKLSGLNLECQQRTSRVDTDQTYK